MSKDILVVGGGIVGVATGLELIKKHPDLSITILEKESSIGSHQTGHNSGVVHAGVYYQPGSLKAQFCREGVDATKAFCLANDIPLDQCGKLLVATNREEVARMEALFRRGIENGLDLERLDAKELRRREPHIVGEGAIYVRTTGIVDYTKVARAMALQFERLGGKVHLSTQVTDMREDANSVTAVTTKGDFVARHAVMCGGLMADRLARLCGIGDDFRVVPFRGQYYRLADRHNQVVKHLIYPIPDPALPFLGVHLTRMIGGFVTVGPNAVLSLGRETYGTSMPNARDLLDTLTYGGFWKVARSNLRSGVTEYWDSLSRKRYLRLCQKYCPELAVDDLLPHPPGIRAQVVMRDGTLLHDFLIRQTARTIHVCNAPSPAATSSIPIARHITELASQAFSLRSIEQVN
ncbi:L-2-hydroxyglutarate oxidase [Paraburkholderia strydomiana]|uniref:L-2-hydroxyglutarate oxidase n=1 Tax=Paraburkholderia strydomiana TaxID=1245417 RepID=A0ABW9EGW1_9BURK